MLENFLIKYLPLKGPVLGSIASSAASAFFLQYRLLLEFDPSVIDTSALTDLTLSTIRLYIVNILIFGENLAYISRSRSKFSSSLL